MSKKRAEVDEVEGDGDGESPQAPQDDTNEAVTYARVPSVFQTRNLRNDKGNEDEDTTDISEHTEESSVPVSSDEDEAVGVPDIPGSQKLPLYLSSSDYEEEQIAEKIGGPKSRLRTVISMEENPFVSSG